MLAELTPLTALLGQSLEGMLANGVSLLKVLIGFSIIIFVHELGHFLAAKWAGIRVDCFSVGFGKRLLGYRSGEGLTVGDRPEYRPAELAERGYGETDYCLRLFPIGGYVRMLGQDDLVIDEKTGEVAFSEEMKRDPRAFVNRPVSYRMVVASAGVVFNLIFAVVLLAAIYIIGKPVVAPIIALAPDSVSAGKLQDGDRVVSINGQRVHAIEDVVLIPIFSSGDLRVTVERAGEQVTHTITPGKLPQIGLPALGVMPLQTVRMSEDAPPLWVGQSDAPAGVDLAALQRDSELVRLPSLQKGDLITHVNGARVTSIIELRAAVIKSAGDLLRLTVDRSGNTHEAFLRPGLRVARSGAADSSDPVAAAELTHLLGFYPRPQLDQALSGSPAAEGGLRGGDVILEVGNIANPRHAELLRLVRASAGKPLAFTVLRDGKRVGPLEVTPRAPFQWFGTAPALIQATFDEFGDTANTVVADVAPDSPAAALNMPRGAQITHVDGAAVSDWADVANALLASAGRSVAVRFVAGSQEGSGQMRVPPSFVNELGLPAHAAIKSVNGQQTLTRSGPGGRETPVAFAGSPWAVAEALRDHVGKTVKIEYFSDSMRASSVEFTVTPENLLPWQLGVQYQLSGVSLEPARTVVVERNPLAAIGLGLSDVTSWVKQAYIMFHMLLVKRTVGVEQLSGPIGIVGVAIDRAKVSITELLSFLAFISVNLAVINFLPVPLLDGGLMVFLILEKLRGKPVSFKVQMIASMVGLAAIVLIGVFVTIQDIGRLFS